ncbi:TPR repeat-containing thioredoxin TTL1-like [Aristolochia californica]|uniref:TPR repeat-containing thioredoxin TTL1-like n=1 Tax=Aristolochia californica TaxID=171875 RepID=UPI0035DE885C
MVSDSLFGLSSYSQFNNRFFIIGKVKEKPVLCSFLSSRKLREKRMTEAVTSPSEKRNGCGVMELYNGVFRRSKFWRRTQGSDAPRGGSPKSSSGSYSKRRRGGGSEEGASMDNPPAPKVAEKYIVSRSPLMSNPVPPSRYQNVRAKPATDLVISNSLSSSGSGVSINNGALAPVRPAQKSATTLPADLDVVMTDYRSNGSLVRVSSSNMMVFGHLGNIRQSVPNVKSINAFANSNSVLDFLPMTAKERAEAAGSANTKVSRGVNRNAVMGNIVKKPAEKEIVREPEGTMCRALSRRLEPEEYKELGNGEFRNGKFAEALAYYELAVSLDPEKASYRSNKSAALTGLGRLLEAVEECREAVRLDPSYRRAHHRLATLYLRLGDAEKAINQYRESGNEATRKELAQAQALQIHLARCNEARKLKDWHTMLKEAGCAISFGADSAPLVYASQAEALLKLHRHHDADATLSTGPSFDPDAATKFFGAAANAYILMTRAQVDMTAGRFEEAVAEAQRAVRLDPINKEAGAVARRARTVAAARSKGNELFKAAKFSEACLAYGEGLDHDPQNAVLLCNRAAARSKLGQWEKAVEDCNAALKVRPGYNKSRLRRADCNAKLERWVASIQDYEALIREKPGDEEVGRALFEAQIQLKKQRGEDVADMKFGSDVVVVVTSNDRFRHAITSPGMSVVLFCKKTCNVTKQMAFTEQLCKRYPSVKFLKVDVEDHPYISKSEGVGSVPSFHIYKNGSKVKDVDGNCHDLLESSVKIFST